MTPPFRLTPQTRQVVSHMLSAIDGDHYGFEILKATGLKPGTVYPTLARFEEAGWIEGRWEHIDPETARRPARRYYRVTAEGTVAMHAVMAEHAGTTDTATSASVAGSAPTA